MKINDTGNVKTTLCPSCGDIDCICLVCDSADNLYCFCGEKVGNLSELAGTGIEKVHLVQIGR